MAELLTESFCERCGTRYTFESAAPRRRLRGIKTLGSGLRTFVLSNDVSLDEAMAAARSDAEREASAHQLDAFHKTFSFCMTCRQYTCGDCWNGVEGRCLTCAPDPTREVVAPSFDLPAVAPVEPPVDGVASPVSPEPPIEPAWPVEASWSLQIETEEESARADVGAILDDTAVIEPAIEAGAPTIQAAADLVARIEGLHEAVPSDDAASQAQATMEPAMTDIAIGAEATAEEEPAVSEPMVAVAPDLEPDIEPGPEPTDATVHRAAGRTSALLARFRPGQSLDAAIAEYEAALDPASTAATVADPASSAPAPEPTTEPALGADAGDLPTEPVAEPVAEPPPAPTATDSAPQPVWQAPAPRPADEAGPQWPTGPRWPTSIPARGPAPQPSASVDPLNALLAHEATEKLWAASNAELAAVASQAAASTPTVHECANCGLSLSATARFCRRCGTRQGG